MVNDLVPRLIIPMQMHTIKQAILILYRVLYILYINRFQNKIHTTPVRNGNNNIYLYFNHIEHHTFQFPHSTIARGFRYFFHVEIFLYIETILD